MTASHKHLTPILKLRLLIAFLGEKKQFGWWDTSFLDATGRGFLERPFPRTAVHAATRSTSEAACRAHDAAIGRVAVFHLFRLPLEQEESLDLRLTGVPASDLVSLVPSKDAALTNLETLINKSAPSASGPIQVGHERQIGTPASVAQLAATYAAAFRAGATVFPYFVQEKEAHA